MAPRKRSFGRIQQLPSGKWRARYTGPDGQLHKASHTFFEHDDAAAWIRGEQKLIEFGEWTPPAIRSRSQEDAVRTVGQWLEEWLEIRSRDDLAPSTLQDYRRTLDARVLKVEGKAARLRDIPLRKLTRRDATAWWDAITVQFGRQPYNFNAYRRLHTAMGAAVDRDLIDVNPVQVADARRRIKPHRKELAEIDVMNDILDKMTGTHEFICIMTFFHGARIGEALGGQRQHIIDHGDEMIFRVRGNAYRKVGVGMIRKDTPKTDAGWRDIPIFPRFHAQIRHHLNTTVGTAPDATLAPTASGKIMMDTSYRSALARAKERAGHGDVRITAHYGRVWLITTLAEMGMPIPAIGEMLGQRDLRTITEIYMRASKERRAEVLGMVNELFKATPEGVADLDAKRAKKKPGSDEAAG